MFARCSRAADEGMGYGEGIFVAGLRLATKIPSFFFIRASVAFS